MSIVLATAHDGFLPARSSAASPTVRHNKVPEIVFGFWVIKIAATTLGETGGDAISMTLNLGYAVGTTIFLAFFLVAATAQIRAARFQPFLYWTAVIATTLVGTTMADFADRSLGIGYIGGSALLFTLVLTVLAAWRWSVGSVRVDTITAPKTEMFYWVTILASNTLGTALGDFLADSGAGYEGGALVFAGALAVVAALYLFTGTSRVLLFWVAYILTRPLGATVGDLLTKPTAAGGFNLSRISSTLILLAFIVACIKIVPQRAGDHPGQSKP
jgi:uncharacterized membrane-anchored protein